MSRPKRAFDLTEFQRGRIVDQHEGGLQRKLSEKLSIQLFTVNRVVVQFTRERKE